MNSTRSPWPWLRPAFRRANLLVWCLVLAGGTLTWPAAATPGGNGLTVGISANPTNLSVGELVVFVVSITNSSPITFSNILGGVNIPAAFSVTGWNASGAPALPVFDPASGTLVIESIGAGVIDTLTITATATNAGSFTNDVALTNPIPSFADVVVLVSSPVLMADLGINKTADESMVTVGDVVTFTIEATNAGPDAVTNAVVLEDLGPGWSLVGISNGPNASFDTATQSWTIFSLPPYAFETLALQAQAVSTGPLTNEVEIVPPPGVQDPNPANNSSTLALAGTPPPSQADIGVRFIAQTNNVYVNVPIVFTLIVTNIGPSDASNIVVKLTLPNQLYVTTDVDPPLPDPPAGTSWNSSQRTWTITNLPAGNAVTWQLAVLPLKGGTFTASIKVLSSAPTDPYAGNNSDSATITYIGFSACGTARLCTAFGGPPNANAIVTLTAVSNLLNTATLTNIADSGGGFCFTNLLGGTYTLTVTPADPISGISVYQDDFVIGPTTAALAIISPWQSITGVVTFGPNGPVYPGINVAVSDGTTTQTVMTAQNGVYLATGLTNSSYTVTPQPPAGMKSFPASASVAVGPGADTCPPGTNFVLQGSYKIQGRLTTCAGNGVVAYATVTLATAQFPNLATYSVGTDGSYTLSGLPPGKYVVTPTHPTFTFTPAMQNVTIASANVVQNFAGAGNNGVLGGRVMAANRSPMAGVTVTVGNFPNGGNPRNAVTAADGTFSFNLPAGNYVVAPVSAQAGLTFTPNGATFAVGGANPSCNNFHVFVGNLNAASVVAIEVVQVCQDWQNTMPLVQGKPTLVRVFLAPTAPNTNTVRVSGATLLVQNGNTTKTLQPRLPAVDARMDYAVRRNGSAGSLAFDLPTTLAKGTVKLTLQWPNGLLSTYNDPQGQQTAVVNNDTTVTFQSTPALPIKWVTVNWKFGTKSGNADQFTIALQRKRLLAGMPTISLAPDNTGQSLDWEPPIDPTAPAGPEDVERLRNDLQTKLKRMRAGDFSAAIYHGVMIGTKIGGQAGGIPAKTSFEDMTKNLALEKNTPTHELGHALGRSHDTYNAFGIQLKGTIQLKTGLCDEVASLSAPDYPMDKHPPSNLAPTLGPMQLGDFHYIYGWDASDNTYISPFNGTADLMSYCSWTTPWVWPGSYTYTNMFNSLVSTFAAPPNPGARPKGGGQAIPCWVVSGEVELTSNTLSLDPLLPIMEPQTPAPPAPGSYTFVLLDDASNVLESIPFGPDLPVVEEDESTNLVFENFVFAIPQVSGVASISIYNQGILLTNRAAPPHAPTVQFLAPLPGSVFSGGPVSLSWSAADLDGNPLTYWLKFSGDGGVDWTTLAFDLTTPEFTIDAGTLPGTTNGYFQVTASDGFDYASAETGPITLPPQPPNVEIDTPLGGGVYLTNAPILLHASAWDTDDGDLPDAWYQWSDNLNGNLGAGNELSVDASTLSPGAHVITVTATNSAGIQSQATVTFTVQPSLPMPITAALLGDQVEFTWSDANSTLAVWATFDLENPNWFLVDGAPTDDATNCVMVLDVPILEDSLFFELAPP